MANVTVLVVTLNTADTSNAGTDGDVYIGIGGREFYLDTMADDFERGSRRNYILGQGSNIRHSEHNDPRNPQLTTERIAEFPAYVRFRGERRGDSWRLANVSIVINDDSHGAHYSHTAPIWMGTRAGEILFLRRNEQVPLV